MTWSKLKVTKEIERKLLLLREAIDPDAECHIVVNQDTGKFLRCNRKDVDVWIDYITNTRAPNPQTIQPILEIANLIWKEISR